MIDDVLRSVWPANHSSIRPKPKQRPILCGWKREVVRAERIHFHVVIPHVWTRGKWKWCVTTAPQDRCLYQAKAHGASVKGGMKYVYPHSRICPLAGVTWYVTHRASVIFLVLSFASSNTPITACKERTWRVLRGTSECEHTATTSPQSLHRQVEGISSALTKKRHG